MQCSIYFSFAYLLENLLKGSINTNMVIIAAVIDLLVVIIDHFVIRNQVMQVLCRSRR